MTDAETGYVAAIPSPSKGQEMYTHLTKMVITFLKVMRHEKVKIRSDQEPALWNGQGKGGESLVLFPVQWTS